MTMDYARLGNTGLTVSRICLGCMSYGDPGATVAGSTMRWQWALKEEEARPFFKRAVELGILVRNPADFTQPPRVDRPQMRVLNESEAATMLKALEEHQPSWSDSSR